jgi:hypothetical protein
MKDKKKASKEDDNLLAKEFIEWVKMKCNEPAIQGCINRYFLEEKIMFHESEILRAYKDYCAEHPDDEYIDKQWERYSFLISARMKERIEDIKKEINE